MWARPPARTSSSAGRSFRTADAEGPAAYDVCLPRRTDQTTVELFYRLILAQNLQLTPSIQMLFDPALNPEDDFVWAYGLRLRLSL